MRCLAKPIPCPWDVLFSSQVVRGTQMSGYRVNRESGIAFRLKTFLPIRPKIPVRVNVHKGSTSGFWSLAEIARTDNLIHCPTVLIDVEYAQNIKRRRQTGKGQRDLVQKLLRALNCGGRRTGVRHHAHRDHSISGTSSAMSLASYSNGRLPVGFFANPTVSPKSNARLFGCWQMNCFPTTFPAFRTERHVVVASKVVVERWTLTHPSQRSQLSFQHCQLG